MVNTICWLLSIQFDMFLGFMFCAVSLPALSLNKAILLFLSPSLSFSLSPSTNNIERVVEEFHPQITVMLRSLESRQQMLGSLCFKIDVGKERERRNKKQVGGLLKVMFRIPMCFFFIFFFYYVFSRILNQGSPFLSR